jgi:protein-S-isoprenylcysteine O-methyltransferase Ste14
MSLIHAGVAVVADSAWVLGLLVPLLIVMRYGVIAREEAYLEGKFGESYVAYRAKVRRWL